MGHSWSVGRVRMSDPPRRAASLPSAIWRRIARSSHLQLGYRLIRGGRGGLVREGRNVRSGTTRNVFCVEVRGKHVSNKFSKQHQKMETNQTRIIAMYIYKTPSLFLSKNVPRWFTPSF